jgi:hypothetical protein
MSDPKLIKQWKIIRSHLEHARRLMPPQVRENAGEVPDHDLATLAAYEDSLDHNELELALDQLEGLGELNECPGGFWRSLEKAAELMELHKRAAILHQRFNETLSAQARGRDA